jgi:hypothetical protein
MGNLNAAAQGDLALCHVTVAAGVPSFTFNRGFSAIADTAAGVVTLTLDNAQDLDGAAIVSVTPNFATFAAATVSITSNTVLVVRTWDAAGAALDDCSFWVRITPVSPQ